MSREQILTEATAYFGGDTLAAQVWVNKYALKNRNGEVLEMTPTEMHRRLAKEFARIEKRYPDPYSEEEIFQALDHFGRIIPGGSPMSGIGNPHVLISLSNCFVIGSNDDSDSYGSIMRSDEEQAQIMKRRGGVGQDLAHLRPNGSIANNSVLGGLSGSVAYAERYSNTTKEVSQGNRRGALMLSHHVNHPDITSFIDSKLAEGKITGANISVKLTDEFMHAVEEDAIWYHSYPISYGLTMLNESQLQEAEQLPLNTLKEFSVEGIKRPIYIKKAKARAIFNNIVKNAWQSAEPGVLFWDRIISESPADGYGAKWATTSTNPCGELPLCPYDSCRLLAINLYSYVMRAFESNAYFDFTAFTKDVRLAMRLMDDLVDLEIEMVDKIINKVLNDPESHDLKKVELTMWQHIREKAALGRRTGLGITAEGDMLAALGLRYGTPEATDFAESVHKQLAIKAYETSIDMAQERGQFPIWKWKNEQTPFLRRIYNELGDNYKHKWEKYGRRNIALLTIAPTGTVSICTQTTSGVEPVFSIYHKRRVRTEHKDQATFINESGEMFIEYNVFHPKFTIWYDKNWYKTDPHLFDIDFHKPLESYSEEELNILITKSPWHKATAQDMDWVAKVELQGRIQKWIDHSISATTNIPKETPVEVVYDIYMKAYKSGCKGMTIYRDGSRSGILVKDSPTFKYRDGVKRLDQLKVDIYHKTALKRDWMVVVGLLENKPYEIFAFPEVNNSVFPNRILKGTLTKVKSQTYKLEGNDQAGKTYTIPNIIDLIDKESQVDTRKFSLMLRHEIDPKWIIKDIEEYALVTSFDKVVQRVLKNYIADEELDACKECGTKMIRQDGCVKCPNCGWSKC